MARRSRSFESSLSVERDPNAIARLLDGLLRPSVTYAPTISDGRVWDPTRDIRPAYVSVGPRSAARVVVDRNPPRILAGVPPRVGFADPRRVDLCRRREARKEVLHARRIAGGRGFKKRTLNEWSKVKC